MSSEESIRTNYTFVSLLVHHYSFPFIVESSAVVFATARLAGDEAKRYVGRFVRHHVIRPTMK